MISVWDIVCTLPIHLVGSNVIHFLELSDLVLVDTALVREKKRGQWSAVLHCWPSVMVLPKHQTSRIETLKWIVVHNICVQHFCVEKDFARNICAVSDHLEGINSLELNCTNISALIECAKFPNVIQKAQVLTLYGGDEDEYWIYVGCFRSLTKVAFQGQQAPWKLFGELFAVNENFCLLSAREEFAGPFAAYAFDQRLTELLLQTPALSDDLLKLIAESCTRLRRINLSVPLYSDRRRVSDAGAMALAQGCPDLESAILSLDGITDSSLITLAHHCTKLHTLETSAEHIFSDAALRSFWTQNTPLRLLNTSWAVRDVSLVLQCGALLSRLEEATFFALDAAEHPSAFLAAIQNLSNVCKLVLDFADEFPRPGEVISVLVNTCVHLTELELLNFGDCDFNTPLCQIAYTNPRLEVVKLTGNSSIGDQALRALAQHCPRLRSIQCAHGAATAHAATTEATFIALATHCRRFEVMLDVNSEQLSDTAVLVFAQNCRRLRLFDVTQAVEVSEAALAQLVRCCEKLEYLYVSREMVSSGAAARLTALAKKTASSRNRLFVISLKYDYNDG